MHFYNIHFRNKHIEWENLVRKLMPRHVARSEIFDVSQSAGSPDACIWRSAEYCGNPKCKQTLEARVNFPRKSWLKTKLKPFIVVCIIYNIRTIIFIGFELRAVAKIVSGKCNENAREKIIKIFFLDFRPHRPYFVVSEISISTKCVNRHCLVHILILKIHARCWRRSLCTCD